MPRLAVSLRGVVQGVGFRPFVHAAASRRGLSGWVRNRSDGLALEVQGEAAALSDFVASLRRDAPPAARVDAIDVREVGEDPAVARAFAILPSSALGRRRATLPADLAICAACSAEIDQRAARRHRDAFASCACCGPRFSIVESLPYDRARTTMRAFAPCPACAAEYLDERDRRFHAQTVSCPRCGPALRLVLPDGRVQAHGAAALHAAVVALGAARIVAVKGLGGYQLLADATSAHAVATLRARKRRPDKPFAVLFASLDAVREACAVSSEEAAWLASPEAPILLLARLPDGRASARVVPAVAPGRPQLGALLPTTALHRLLAADFGRPLVCTSGNLSGEPICSDEVSAAARLGGIADLRLEHDRAIVRPIDDSVARVGPRGLELERRARGFAPVPLAAPGVPPGIVALGAQQKSTVAVSLDGEIVVSQHLGDLHCAESAALLESTVADLLRLFALAPRRIVCDLHPDYASTQLALRLARALGVPLERVQHHHAHVAACVAEHRVAGPVLGLAWDGAGLGGDGTVWGGEALVVAGARARRVAHLRPFCLPGGERAIREPRRAALALLHALGREHAAAWAARDFTGAEARVLLAMLDRGLGPATTSMGRLFDAVAALVGLRAVASYEAQAAIELEEAADAAGDADAEPYPIPLLAGEPAIADWKPLVRGVLHDHARGVATCAIAARFHASLATLAEAIVVRSGLEQVVLAGGCFQNRRLEAAVRARLEARGCAVLAPRLYPPNDGAIALGQVHVAAARMQEDG